MNQKKALAIARKYAAVVETNFDCKGIYLFGSHATGNSNEESDIDIAVVLSDYENIIDTQVDLMRLRRNIDSRIEPHPFRERDFNRANPVVDEILRHGKRIDANAE